MTDVIDLRGSGIVARAGLEAPVQKGMASLERLSELFETGHDGLAADMLRKRNNSNPTNEGLEMAVNMRDNFTESEMRRWFRELERQDVNLSEALLDFKFNLFSEADPAVAANTAFQLYESGILNDASKMEASEMLLECGSPDKAILMIGSIENIEFRVAASQLAATSARAIKNIESQADAWRLIADRFGVQDADLLIAASRMYSAGRHTEVIDLLAERDSDELERSLGLLLARSYFTVEEYDNCLNVSRSMLERHPDDQDVLRLIIRSKRRQGDVGDEEAFQALSRSLELGTIHPEDAYRLARTLVENEDWEAASKAIDAVFSGNGYEINERHIVLKSRILVESGREKEARDWLISNDEGDSVSITRALASILHRMRDDEGALEARRRVLENDPHDTGIRRGVCTSLLRLGRLEEAMLESKEIIQILPTDASAWDVLIETLARMGREQETDSAWEEVLDMSWDNPEGLLLAVEICLRFDWANRLDWILRSRLNIHRSRETNAEIHHMMMQKGRFDLSKMFEKYLGPRSTESSRIARSLEIDLGATPHSIMEYADRNLSQTESVILEHLIRSGEGTTSYEAEEESVLILTSSLNAGGAERQVILTGAGLRNQGWKSTIGVDRIDAQHSGETLQSMAESLDLNVIEFRDVNLESEEADELIQLHANILSNLRPIERERSECIIRMIMKTRPRIIHAWQDAMIYPAAIANFIVGSNALIGSVRSLNPDEKSLLHGRKRPFLRKSLRMLCDVDDFRLLNNSQAGRESYARWLGISEDEISVIRNGVMDDGGKGVDLKHILDIPVDSELIGGVFRLVPEKRPLLWVDSAWECIKNRKDAFAVIIGEGRMRKEVENRIHEIGANGKIILHGFREDASKCYDSFDVTLLTSSTEGLPNVLIESQARGVPVVSTDVGGVNESLSDGSTGILLKGEDIGTIKSALTLILDDWDMDDTSGACRSFIEQKFGMERMARDTKEAYESLLSSM
jgi:glycosyltransferase involved in cell wall biosynthesis/tetratricopeptide (TPR) repeat protein